MTTQNNLTLFTGDGPINIDFMVLQDGQPMSLVGVNNVVIALKGGSDQPDPPLSASNVFGFNDGIALTNAGAGLGTWTVPASFLAGPGTYWWHGTLLIQGSVFTWGFGVITVAAI